MKAEESYKYSIIIDDENKKGRIWLDASTCNIEKEKAEKIIREVEAAKEHIKKILAE